MKGYATIDQLNQLALILKKRQDEQNESIRSLSWEMAKLSFWLAVMRKTHPDQQLMDRALEHVRRAEEIPDRATSMRELLGSSVADLLGDPD
jgi:hypothetical protein